MANYATSELNNGQAKLMGKFAADEMRFRTPVVHLEFLRNSSIMLPAYESLRLDESRAVDAYFADRNSRSLLSTRDEAHTGAKGTSTVFSPTWLTNADVFKISLKQGGSNVLSRGDMFAQEMENVAINMVEGMDANAETHLFGNRTTANPVTTSGTFDATDDCFDITESTDGETAWQITEMVMDLNKFSGPVTVFCDSIAFHKFEKQRFQGAGNSTNLSFQFGNNLRIVHAAGLTSKAAGLSVPRVKGFWIAVQDGTICSLPWIPKENRQGVETKENAYGTMLNPIDGLSYATHMYDTRSDESALGGEKQDVVTQVEVSVDIALDNSPLTVSGGSATSTLVAFALI